MYYVTGKKVLHSVIFFYKFVFLGITHTKKKIKFRDHRFLQDHKSTTQCAIYVIPWCDNGFLYMYSYVCGLPFFHTLSPRVTPNKCF